jgi:hypothetical protein
MCRSAEHAHGVSNSIRLGQIVDNSRTLGIINVTAGGGSCNVSPYILYRERLHKPRSPLAACREVTIGALSSFHTSAAFIIMVSSSDDEESLTQSASKRLKPSDANNSIDGNNDELLMAPAEVSKKPPMTASRGYSSK